MKTLYQQISEKFLAKLSGTRDIDSKKIEQLRVLFTNRKKLKVDDLVKLFSGAVDDEVK